LVGGSRLRHRVWGTILKLLDQVAYACASRYASRYVVTASVDNFIFRERIQVGELVTFGFGKSFGSVVDGGRHQGNCRGNRSQVQRHV